MNADQVRALVAAKFPGALAHTRWVLRVLVPAHRFGDRTHRLARAS